MSDLNIVCLFGRITKDAEQKKTEKGTDFVQFSIAVNRERTTDDGQAESFPSFFLLRIYGKWGTSLFPYLKRGQAITLEGHLVQLRWEKDGQYFSRIDIVPNNIRLIGSIGSRKEDKKSSSTEEIEFSSENENKTEDLYQDSYPDDTSNLDLF